MLPLPRDTVKSLHCPKCTYRHLKPATRCPFHKAHHRQHMREYQQKKKAAGRCARCKKPVTLNRTLCSQHAQQHAIRMATSRYGRPSQRKTCWNPNVPALILDFVYKTNPYLHPDWDIAKAFILKHHKLWHPHYDAVWWKRVYIEDINQWQAF